MHCYNFSKEWKKKDALQRLCMMRALRADRMTYAMQGFIEEKLGSKFVGGSSVEFAKSFEESGPATPVFFILSPGVNPLKVNFPEVSSNAAMFSNVLMFF